MRRSKILSLRWQNVDLENNTFDLMLQSSCLFKISLKSNGRKLPITELAHFLFPKQLAVPEAQKKTDGKSALYYETTTLLQQSRTVRLFPLLGVSSQFDKLLEDLDIPHIRFHNFRHTAATNIHQSTGDFYTISEAFGHTLAGINASLRLFIDFEAVTTHFI